MGKGTMKKPYFFPDAPEDNEMPDMLRRTRSRPHFSYWLPKDQQKDNCIDIEMEDMT